MVTPNGCTDRHASGPAVLIDSDGTWYCHVRPGGVSEIIESHLCGGRPVERLLCPE
jgi:(2Fe-2S) ferredoxin